MASNHNERETARLYLSMLASDRARFEALETYYVRKAHDHALMVSEIALAADMTPARVRQLLG
jgi:hypothetical protein